MATNHFCQAIENDIKIQNGLKVLQFATQHHLQKVYFRSCPLSTLPRQNQQNSLEKLQQQSQIKAQLNTFLMDPSYQKNSFGEIKKTVGRSSKDMGVNSFGKKESVTSKYYRFDDNNIGTGSAKAIDSTDRRQIITSQIVMKKEIVAQPQQQSTNTMNAPAKPVASYPHHIDEPALHNISSHSSSSQSYGSFQRSKQSKPELPEQQLKLQELGSYYSDCRPMSVIKEANQQSEEGSVTAYLKKAMSRGPQGYNLSDFRSIPSDISIGHSTIINNPRNYAFNLEKHGNCRQQAGKSSVSSQKGSIGTCSLLNRQISEIKASSEVRNSFVNSKVNLTELDILKQFTNSLERNQKLELLLQLENTELEENLLLQAIEKRFQKCYQHIDGVRNLSWESLKMPKPNLFFRRPNYAHCVPDLK